MYNISQTIKFSISIWPVD